MPTPSIGKVVQYLPSNAVDSANNVDVMGLQAALIIQVTPWVNLRVFASDVNRDFVVTNVPEDDTQTTPNSWTYASQTT
jgi:hypothetical protein